ncbi:hypothetical protein IU397_22950 [Actibacterium sp. 188UL27-1]|nr:hypothetical protein [Actibacterium sp. 188UL27-1]
MRAMGPNAGSLKYDILTAISVTGMNGPPVQQVSMARLGLLITARYNWRREELSVGQRDMARMWNVTERTVKREIKRWTESKLLICKRAGVRGRVGAYRLNLPELFRISGPFWAAVGPDFAERMAGLNPVQEATVVKVDFSQADAVEDSPIPKGSWRAVLHRLRQLHPESYANWMASVSFISDDGRHVTLGTQTKFAARYIETHLMAELSEAIETELGPFRRVILIVDG